ncbi:MAG: hypothetical protein ABT940_09045 [Alphaproteobacteria bacterium]
MGDLSFGVTLNTSKTVESLEKWLEKNCHGKWDVQVEGLSDDLAKKKISVYFQIALDRDQFKKSYGSIR